MKVTSIPALQKAAQKRKSSLSGLLGGVEKQLKQLQHIRDALKEGRMKTAPPVEHLVTLITPTVLLSSCLFRSFLQDVGKSNHSTQVDVSVKRKLIIHSRGGLFK